MILKTLLLSTLLFVATLASAATDVFWEKERLEQTATEKIQAALKPVVSNGSFGVLVTAKVRSENSRTVQSVSTSSINLGKLGGSVDFSQLRMENGEEAEKDFAGRIIEMTATLTLPTTLEKDREETARQLAQAILKGFGKFRTNVSVEKSASFDAAVEKKAEDSSKSAPLSQSNWPVSGAILGATLILSIMALWIARRVLALETRKISAIEAQANEESIERRTTETRSNDAIDSTNFQPGHGLVRIQSLCETNPAKAALLIRQWLSMDTEESLEALAHIGRFIRLDHLEKTSSFLDDSQRDKWRQAVQSDRGDVESAERFLRIRSLDAVSTESEGGKELQELVFDFTAAECVEVATKSARDGALLLNILPAIQVSRMLSLLSSEKVSELAHESFKFDSSKAKFAAHTIRQAILERRETTSLVKTPFAQKAPELIREMDAEREAALFQTLIDAGHWPTVRATALQAFPSQLIGRLPADLLKGALGALPVAERAELILAAPQTLQSALLNSLGTTGKLRELINIQLDQLRSNANAVARIEKQRASLQRRLANRVRQHISGSESHVSTAEQVVDAWLSELSRGKNVIAA